MPNLNRFDVHGGAPSDTLGGFQSALLSCGSIDEMRNLAPLPKDAQEAIDSAVIQVGLDRLVITADVMAEGLTFNLPDPLSVLELYWEKQSKAGYAQRTMTPGTRGEDQLSDRTGVRIPIYATTDDFSFGIRVLRAAERAGTPLDTNGVSQATRRVNEAIEDAFINGAGLTVDGETAPGLLNAPNVNTQAYVDTEAWTHANHSGQDILDDVLNMIGTLQADRKFGPYNLYIPTTYGNEINKNFGDGVTTFDMTIRQRLEAIKAGGRDLRIRVADQLPTDRTALVQMTSDVVDVVVGQEPTVVSWQDGPGWNRFFVVLAFMCPRVKDDYDGGSGICVGDTS